ncbi:MAG: hypothetical protein MUF61_02285 [archaeon]|jgi:hypothetical protein|nr:hypothetical protein [archaeon]
MGIFGGGTEYLDYTLLKKKGILKLPEEKQTPPIKQEGGFVDFTAFRTESPEQSVQPSPSNEISAPVPNFDFLGNMAAVGASAPETNANPLANFDTFTPATPALSASDIPGNADGKEINAMKIKMDDIEYKIDRFIERIDKLEEKLGRLSLS